MSSRIKVIKRGASGEPNGFAERQVEKTEHDRNRDTASTVKGWISEWEERKRSLQIASFKLVRALDQSRQTSVHAVTVN